jgi:hypothetical protein
VEIEVFEKFWGREVSETVFRKKSMAGKTALGVKSARFLSGWLSALFRVSQIVNHEKHVRVEASDGDSKSNPRARRGGEFR